MNPINYHIFPKVFFELEQLGISCIELCKSTDLNYEKITNSPNELTHREKDLIWEAAARMSNNPEFGFYVGTRIGTEVLGILGKIYQNASNIGEILSLATKFGPMITDVFKYSTEVKDERVTLNIIANPTVARDYPNLSIHRCLFSLGISVRLYEQLVMKKLKVLKLAIPRSVKTTQFVSNYMSLIVERTDQLIYSVDFPAEILTQKTISGNHEVFSKLLAYALESLEKNGNSWEEKVKKCLIENYHSQFLSVNEIAAQMNISPRSLQRRLSEENTSFRSILNQVRLELVKKYYLQNSNIKDLASFMGFSSISNFYRAFKHWTGVTFFNYFERVKDFS